MPGGQDLEPFELHLEQEDPSSSWLYQAICEKDAGQVLNALHSGENVYQRQGHTHYTYLHLLLMVSDASSEEKCLPIVYQLCNAGLDVNSEDSRGCTSLQMAIHKHLRDIMVALIRCGVDLQERDYKSTIRDLESPFELEMLAIIDKYEPGLWAAVGGGSTGMVSLLVNSWCRINIYKGKVSLMQYAKHTKQSPDMLSVLDDYEVTLEFVHATLAGDEKRMLEFLMDSKPCDPYIMDISYQERWSKPLEPRSLRDAAKSMGHTHVLHLLPEGDYESVESRTVQTKEQTSEGMASCSDYSSAGSNPDTTIPASFPADMNFTMAATSFSHQTPRLSTFKAEPIDTGKDRHYVQGFFFHEPETAEEEQVYQSTRKFPKISSPHGTLRGRKKKTYGLHDYSHNWEEGNDTGGKGINGHGSSSGKEKGSKGKQTKSKMCVIS